MSISPPGYHIKIIGFQADAGLEKSLKDEKMDFHSLPCVNFGEGFCAPGHKYCLPWTQKPARAFPIQHMKQWRQSCPRT